MKWIPVTEALPEIPKGKYSISVLVCEYDPIYDEDESDPPKSRGCGSSVNKFVSYGKFKDISNNDKEYFGFNEMADEGWIPCVEQITHWMYLPEPPPYKAKWNAEKDILEYVYVELS